MLHFKAFKVAIFGAAAIAALIGAPASATIVTITYTGTVASDFINNPYGLFGNPSVGDTIVTRLVFDTSRAEEIPPLPPGTEGSGLQAGSATGEGPSVGFVVSASITIGSTTMRIISANDGYLYDTCSAQNCVLSTGVGYYDMPPVIGLSPEPPGANFTQIYGFYVAANGAFPTSLTTPFSYAARPGDSANTGISTYASSGLDGTVAGNVDSVALSVGTPEPSTWAMLLLGFAGLGFAGYQRARVA